MLYNLYSPVDVQNARTRLDMLIGRSALIELTEKKHLRSINQNSYLHLILGYFASQTGNTREWVKQQYYKRQCNPDLFIAEKEDKYVGKIKYIRSSSELDTADMSLSIERFRNWASSEAGIYIPDAMSSEELASLQIEVERYKEYI